MAHSHVPKFGNWEDDIDNVPYTAYFENARREKAGIMINPNDPMENPEAFNNPHIRGGQNVDADHKTSSVEKRSHTPRHLHHRSRGSRGSFTAEYSAIEISHSDHSVIQRRPKSDHRRSVSKGGSIIDSISSSSHNRHRSGSRSFNDNNNHEATAIPKFGAWDVTDPRSGEGYTAIFSKLKQEKQIASSHNPTMNTPPLDNCSNIQNQSRLSKAIIGNKMGEKNKIKEIGISSTTLMGALKKRT